MSLVLTEFVTLDDPGTWHPASGLLLLEYETVGAAPVAEYGGVTAYL